MSGPIPESDLAAMEQRCREYIAAFQNGSEVEFTIARTKLIDRCVDLLPRLIAAYRAVTAEAEQSRVQLAGVSVAALGGTRDPAVQGQYGWTPAYQDVLDLRRKYEVEISHRGLRYGDNRGPWTP